MTDPVARLNAALQGRYAIERELGEGGMATVASPLGGLAAYTSDESGTDEVYVRNFPGVGSQTSFPRAAAHSRFGPRTATRSTTGRWEPVLRSRA